MADVLRIAYGTLCQRIAQRLQEAGIPYQQAVVEASIMAEADLQEVASHGVRMLPGLLSALEDGRVKTSPVFSVERELGAICVLDCGNGPGRYAATHAMEQAKMRAQQFGVGICLAKRTTHWGRAHAYASRAAQEGFIGICTTNAIPSMAIGGARKAVIGNNPLAIGIPGINASEPIVLDMAMSQAAVGKVGTWLREGKALPDNWGIDALGNRTSDASAILAGAVLPMGEHKGAGLAVMIELLTAALAGAAFTQQLLAGDQSGIDPNATKIFIALNVNAFIELHVFRQRVRYFLDYLKTEATPFNDPGERGWQVRQLNLLDGVPLHMEIVARLESVGVDLRGAFEATA
ncbi:MAG TPA: Ldh family oxidoreductase [Cellvibrio sp.]|nr:Ldh family oxidoreductase [Cellvibrio sp.]